MPDLVRPVDAADLPIMERLWQLFRHDLSEFTELLPNPDGTFGGNRLHTAFTDADRAPHLLMSDNSPVGFVVVRGLLAPTRVLNAFFVVRGARRKGIGLQAVRDVTTKYPAPVGSRLPGHQRERGPLLAPRRRRYRRRGMDGGAQAGAEPAGPPAGCVDLFQRPGLGQA